MAGEGQTKLAYPHARVTAFATAFLLGAASICHPSVTVSWSFKLAFECRLSIVLLQVSQRINCYKQSMNTYVRELSRSISDKRSTFDILF